MSTLQAKIQTKLEKRKQLESRVLAGVERRDSVLQQRKEVMLASKMLFPIADDSWAEVRQRAARPRRITIHTCTCTQSYDTCVYM